MQYTCPNICTKSCTHDSWHASKRHRWSVRCCRSREADSNGEQDFAFQKSPEASSPIHPWSVKDPRYLGTPAASQPPTLTMDASAAAAPVGPGSASASAIAPAQPMAISQHSPEAHTAIPASAPILDSSGNMLTRPSPRPHPALTPPTNRLLIKLQPFPFLSAFRANNRNL